MAASLATAAAEPPPSSSAGSALEEHLSRFRSDLAVLSSRGRDLDLSARQQMSYILPEEVGCCTARPGAGVG